MDNINYQINRNAQRSFSLQALGEVFRDWVKKLLPMRKDFKKSQQGTQELELKRPATANSDAEFLGWQGTPTGEIYALYNIVAKQHPLYKSTVSEQTLRKHGLQVPPTPPPLPEQLLRVDHEK